jgi:L-threonylcarbamoyladenylate synthase
MKTTILTSKQADRVKSLELTTTALQQGQIVGLPTETVYGLAADATNIDALLQLFKLKARPKTHAFSVHILKTDLARWTKDIPAKAQILIDTFWPGPLTLILPKADHVNTTLTGGRDKIGVRCPDHAVFQAILKASGLGLACTSANRHGGQSATNSKQLLTDFNDLLPLILDDGPASLGLDSTIIDLTTDTPEVLRIGSISIQTLENTLKTGIKKP